MKCGVSGVAFTAFVFMWVTAAPAVVAESKRAESIVTACAKHCPTMKRIDRSNAPAALGTPSKSAASVLFVSIHTVTFAQWERCVRAGRCGGYRPDRQGVAVNSPVMNISFHDATRYVQWLSTISGERYRLVYEDEWSLVALAQRTSEFAWGDALGRNNANCLDCGSRWDGRSVSPVASFKSNDFGLFDTMGNVAHWVAVRPSAEAANNISETTGHCKGKSGYSAIVNASWAEPAIYMNPSDFTCFPKVLRDDTIGFRVALER
jgi:formylglycine-generating enzyme required for sulfatase activity